MINLTLNNDQNISPLLFKNEHLKTFILEVKKFLDDYIDKRINAQIKKATKSDLKSGKEEKQKELYLTINEACKLLKISKTTLWRWSENGRIKKYYIFGNPRFLREDILSIIKSVEPLNQ